MTRFLSLYFTGMACYTAWCAAYGPPFKDAYGLMIRAAWQTLAQ